MAKYLFVTGSVVSYKDKGIATSFFGQVLKSQGTVTTLKKLGLCSNVYPDVSCHTI